MNYEELENWAQYAAEKLQEICDEAQEAAGVPDGECQLQDIRLLLHEHSRIVSGQPAWQAYYLDAGNAQDDKPLKLDNFD